MSRRRDIIPGAVAALLVLVLLALAATVWWLHHTRLEPHGATLRVVAPGVVADSVADRANALPGRPFDARTSPDAESARRSVAEGRSTAALVVDLTTSVDTLYVAPANGARLNRAMARQVSAVEESLDRTLVVRPAALAPGSSTTAPSTPGPSTPDPGPLVAAWLVLGFLTCVVISFVRGPVATTATRSVVRVSVVVGVAVLLGLASAAVATRWYPGHLGGLWLLGTLTVFTAAMCTLALEGLAGYAGLALAAAVVVLVGAPMFGGVAPLLQPEPWSSLSPWVPHGASLAATTQVAVFGGVLAVKPVLVLVSWAVLALLTTLLARSGRARTAEQDTDLLQHGS